MLPRWRETEGGGGWGAGAGAPRPLALACDSSGLPAGRTFPMLPADLQHHLRGQPWRPTSLDLPSTAVDPVQFLGLELPPLLLITQSCGGWLLLFSSELQSYTPPDLLGHATPDSYEYFALPQKGHMPEEKNEYLPVMLCYLECHYPVVRTPLVCNLLAFHTSWSLVFNTAQHDNCDTTGHGRP